MDEPVNPLFPVGFDIAWSTMVVVVIALVVVALVSLARTASRLTSMEALIWTLVTIFVPVVGAVAWLSIGRRSALAAVR
jgi:Phospholipase_D-nuclease N-terminal